ncbi:LacI family transcriptional regulator [Bacillus sp. AFS076308]|uniref:LacI family DNA-binding transcriptional regulator n=1 Tax=unclassified Bacillus (in: firmicutes) TaxID=185979 RepID=UPI000BF2B9A8|nr:MULTISPECIES: LacI family DNA-binding transcriptional regulator [unclassified Bacillus (in: firmicutes)]PFN74844.1 LacI family transcriptional regulator [Bacillus sp. AFS076308]PGV50917.1 LacI family transcriptional regulator [Bacillus sp. AFS037270]
MKQKNRLRVTLKDVAEHAGVSRATASLIVRNSPNVSEKTRKKVLESMDELGYVYDRVAANLRSKRSSTVGVIFTDIANTYFSDLLKGVSTTLEAEGYTVLLGTTFDSEEKQVRLLSTMLEHRVDGIILCPVSGSSKEPIEKIIKLDIPIVHAVREIADVECDYVGIDYLIGSQLAVNHLINNGHQRIAFVGGRRESTARQQRVEGLKQAFQSAGIEVEPSMLISTAPTRDGGALGVKELFKLGSQPTAIFCFNDIVALGVMEGLRELDIVPGKDIAVVGFDDIPEASITNPPLTTVSSRANQIGSNAASLLHKRILEIDRPKEHIILHPELVIRDSTFELRQ